MKKARLHSKLRPDAVDLLDETEACCRHISTLARLLGVCGKARATEKLEGELVSTAGWMIFDETQRLRGLLNGFRRKGQV